jgi:hypothetical protein
MPASDDPDLTLARSELERDKLGFVIVKAQRVVISSRDHGIGDLITAAEELRRNGVLASALADRIVGQAALMVGCWADIRALHAGLISEAALEEARRRGLPVTFRRRVPRILNRQRSGPCPFELAASQAIEQRLTLDEIIVRLREVLGAMSWRPASDRPRT